MGELLILLTAVCYRNALVVRNQESEVWVSGFAEVLEQEGVKTHLRRAAGGGRLHHAWLFVGRRGVGKRTAALAFAQALMCERSAIGQGAERFDGCGECRHCRRVAQLEHPDLEILASESRNISVDQVRALQHKIAFRPFEARVRVVMVHEAEKLQEVSANAMLKTLEEPTESTLFVLTTHQPGRLLPTIISRCQLARFTPFSTSALLTHLQHRGVDLALAQQAAALAEGSLGEALSLAESGEDLERVFGFLDGLERAAGQDPAAILELAEEMSSATELDLYLVILRLYLRDLLVLNQGADEHLMLTWRRAAMQDLARRLSHEKILAVLTELDGVSRGLAGYAHKLLSCEHLLLEVATLFH